MNSDKPLSKMGAGAIISARVIAPEAEVAEVSVLVVNQGIEKPAYCKAVAELVAHIQNNQDRLSVLFRRISIETKEASTS